MTKDNILDSSSFIQERITARDEHIQELEKRIEDLESEYATYRTVVEEELGKIAGKAEIKIRQDQPSRSRGLPEKDNFEVDFPKINAADG